MRRKVYYFPSITATPRAAIMAVFAAFGANVGVLAGAVPQLMAQTGLNNANYGIGITLMTIATVLAMGYAGVLARHFSNRAILLFLLPLQLILSFLLLTGNSFWLFYLIAMAYGIAGGTIDVIMNAEGGAIEIELKRPVYTAFHGAVSLSVAVFAIVSSLLSTTYGTWSAVLVSGIMVMIASWLVYLAVPARPLAKARVNQIRITEIFSVPIILIGLAAGLIITCEVTALLWSSELLYSTAPGLAAISGLGAAFFALCNAMVRFPGDQLRARFGEIPLMICTLTIAIMGFVGLGTTSSFGANVFFFALTGFGLSILCPCLFAMASRQTPHNRAAGLGAAMLVAGLPRIIAPTLFGAIAEEYSTRFAFGLCAFVAFSAMLVIILLSQSLSKKNKIQKHVNT